MTQKELIRNYSWFMRGLLNIHAVLYMQGLFKPLMKRCVNRVYEKEITIRFTVVSNNDPDMRSEECLKLPMFSALTSICQIDDGATFLHIINTFNTICGANKCLFDESFMTWANVYSECVNKNKSMISDELPKLICGVRDYNVRILNRCAKLIWRPLVSITSALCVFIIIKFWTSDAWWYAAFMGVVLLFGYVILPNIAAILHVADLRSLYKNDYRFEIDQDRVVNDHVDYHCPDNKAIMRVSFSSIDKETL